MLIAQLSDTHVRPAGQLYKGVVDSNRMFAEAIAHLQQLQPPPDLVLISGDLVDEGAPAEYAMLRELLRPLTLPLRLMPGNHDGREALRQAFADHAYLPASGPLHWVADEGPVRVVALDSCLPGRHHGVLDAASLDWLRGTLAAAPQQPTLLLLHHPPFASGMPSMDAYRLRDAAPLEAIVAASPQVQAVLCGHVHRLMFRRWAGTVVAACPSTTTQIALHFLPGAPEQSFIGPAACLLHRWQPGEGLVSHLSPIGPQAGPYPFI
ncbi:phosphodiesterase [Aquabacterium sp. OR-4]|uniref:phosphodiesterase n=1 Tax=Aquabacterium sp. OR-4 TaxID=2978127 RepID=UPI0021B37BDF|nr:phosphodiesterase [Aquabacterium sp. OR-4]MDT7833732.1 phosphodiesterase [Aquabacterium sp. OR-4]